jgi:hydrogenase maturation protein HypF
VTLVAVQHHHAHIVSVLAECGVEGEVLGVSYDGTGYGTDGTVWGGEILKCDRRGYTREGHLRAVSLPGGEGAIAHPARMALSFLLDAFGAEAGLERARALLPSLDESEARVVARQIERGINSPMCSSAGRLFDAVGALLGAAPEVTYEGQPAMELEAMASEWAGGVLLPYRYDIEQSVIDTRLVIRGIVADLERGVGREEIAARFHETVAAFTVDLCRRLGEHYGLSEVALSGGVMQNARLLRRLLEGMREVGLTPYVHREVPPNDGGMSLGQAVVAASNLG